MRLKCLLIVGAAAVLIAGFAIAYRLRKKEDSGQSDKIGPRLLWVFEAPKPGFVVAAPLISDAAIFLAVGHTSGFHSRGAVYAVDPITGKSKWVFDRGGEMLPTASTPLLVGDRLFVGEGLHHNFACRLQCLDPRSGAAKWSFPTGDHIEGGAAVVDDTIIFPAGNDGLYALDSTTGKQKWNFSSGLHVDSTPWIENGRVYVGSGPSRRFDTLQAICLESKTGNPIWRTPVKLPAWGSPTVARNRVFVGLGNGRLTMPAVAPEVPAGALACFDAASGTELWNFGVGDAVFGRPAIVGETVVFGSRDRNLYGVSFEGREVFRIPMGGPVMASATASGGFVYCVSVPGRMVCLNPADGSEVWRYELSQRGAPAEVYSSPRVSGSRLYQAGEMKVGQAGYVCLHCLELPNTDDRETK
ncbi:MAG TPA: PQQ-binding-like beta-propeller repeat protein [Gemmata sp.]|jgi:outer membrane protein assembly factor BamB|nr:PQQ-binding-like beta-propeller repeat protein [Gemmata sp.]